MAAKKKKIKSQAQLKRPAPKPKAKASAKRAPPKPKAAAAPKKAQPRAAVAKPKAAAKPQLKLTPAHAPEPVAEPSPPPASIVRPGLQKRPDAIAICVVTVTDGDRLIEESTFYSTAGRDEYVQRWKARGYTCRFTQSSNGAAS